MSSIQRLDRVGGIITELASPTAKRAGARLTPSGDAILTGLRSALDAVEFERRLGRA
jgi:hypothetical protein